MPDKQGFDYAFGFLDQRHAHRQFTDHLYRNGERVAADLEGDYVSDLFTKEAAAFIEQDDPRPFFLYLNYTVPHAELRAPEDCDGALSRQVPGEAVRECRKPTPCRAGAARHARRSATDRSRRRMPPSPR